jgi:hypothetical protein
VTKGRTFFRGTALSTLVASAALGAVASVLLVVPGAWANIGSSHQGTAAGSQHQVVVTLATGADQRAVVASTRAHGSRIGPRYRRVFSGFAATVTDAELARLRHDPLVRAVDTDSAFYATDTEAPTPSWGLDRIDQRLLPQDNSFTYPSTGQGVTVYVLDTGISPIADLGSRLLPGVDVVPGSACDPAGDTTDRSSNGHGTFVADEIAGTSYGAAKGASVVPVKVLGCSGGSLSTILAGLDWVAQNASGPSIVNMSLTSNAVETTVYDAITSLADQGITTVVAAGNGNGSHRLNSCDVTPGGAPDAIAVGATDSSEAYASFANFGPCVALSAPGVDITAVNNTGSPTMLSGTSQASPEVAGVGALTLSANPALTPAALRACLVADATPGQIQSMPAGTPNLMLYLPQHLACTTVTGKVKGSLAVGPGVTLINGATIGGKVTVGLDEAVAISGSALAGSLTAIGANLVTACDSTFSAGVTVTGATGPVTLGGTAGSSCGPNTVKGALTVSSDSGGVTVAGDTISGALGLSANSGGVTVAGNSVGSGASVNGTTPGYFGAPTVVTANTISGKLACSQNSPSPVNNGEVNIAAGGGTGQCQDLAVKTAKSAPTGHIYWANNDVDGTINRAPLAGGTPASLVALQDLPLGVAVDASYIYWANQGSGFGDGTINKAPIAGGPVTILATGQAKPSGVAVDASHVYWANLANGTINEVPLAGGPVTTLADGQPSPVGVAVDAHHIYWATQGRGGFPFVSGTINEVPLAGGTVTTMYSGQTGATGVAVDASHIYWANGNGTISNAPLAGGPITTLASGQSFPVGVAVDASRVYWANRDNGTINAVPIAGGTPTTLVSGLSEPLGVAIGP